MKMRSILEYGAVPYPQNDSGFTLAHIGYHIAAFVCGLLDGKKEHEEKRRQDALDSINLQGQELAALKDTTSWMNTYLQDQLATSRGELTYKLDKAAHEKEELLDRIEELEKQLKAKQKRSASPAKKKEA